jgi:predicted nuclease with TOPRIM domain
MTAPTDGQARTAETNGTATAIRDDIERRLEDLRGELRTGQERLRELDDERVRVRETVLRIEGAILALEDFRDPASET